MPDDAPWLKAMENGGLGEARARAFLMERFWVLERSVDVEGADYLIQRRLTATNFLDSEPPRLGVVQVKFIESGNTYIKVPKDYLTDRDGRAYEEFFLIVFTGQEDAHRTFLLSSKDMLNEFDEIEDNGKYFLRIHGAKLIDNSKYEVIQRKLALDRIEHALKNADFFANRKFLGRTSYVKISADQIDHDLTLPLDNSWTDIQRDFFKGKKKLQSTFFDLEEVSDAIQKILRSTDPLEAQRIYEEAISDFVGRSGYRDTIQFRIDFFDEDFLAAVKNHRERLAKLRELGIEGAYFKLMETYDRIVLNELEKITADSKIKTVRIAVSYRRKSLRDPTVNISGLTTKFDKEQVVSSEKGSQTVIVPIPHEITKAASDTERVEQLKKYLWTFSRPFFRALDKLYLGEKLLAF